jgi:hypothetical protein
MPPLKGFKPVLPGKPEERLGTIYKTGVPIQKDDPVGAVFQQEFKVFLRFFSHGGIISFGIFKSPSRP